MIGKKQLMHKPESRALLPGSPLRDLQQWRNVLSTALEDFLGEGRAWPFDFWGGRTWAPAVDVEENEKEYTFEVELPGLEKDDFKVEIQNGVLRIIGERKEKKEEKAKHYLRHEQYYGEFRREFSMPSDVDPEGIKATYKNGVLTVIVPRSERSKPKAVPINVT